MLINAAVSHAGLAVRPESREYLCEFRIHLENAGYASKSQSWKRLRPFR